MKGIELPINALIIIAIALLVLLGITSLWMSGWGGGSQGVTIEAAKAAGCGALLRNSAGCTSVDPTDIKFDGNIPAVPKFNVGSDTNLTNDNLQDLCLKYYSASTAASCRIICGCGG